MGVMGKKNEQMAKQVLEDHEVLWEHLHSVVKALQSRAP